MVNSLLRLLFRQYPFYSGCGTLANSTFIRRLDAGVAASPVWTTSPGGDLLVYPDDWVGRTIMMFGDLDPKLTWVLKQLVKSGDHVADIGANFGLISLLLARLVGPTGKVHAFEPNPALAAILGRSISRNNFDNVVTYPFGLGRVPAEMILRVPAGNLGAASLVRASAICRDSLHVIVKPLDEVFDDSERTRLGVVKIDVEGFELEVLKGAVATLQSSRPVILFEANNHDASETAEVLRFLDHLNYRFLQIPRCLFRMRTRRLQKETATPTHDLIGCPAERYVEISRVLRAN